MNQTTTAVVLDENQECREQIREHLSHCGVMPICFMDQWICLENIHHLKPGFAVIRTDSQKQVTQFVNLAKAIDSNFPVIVLSDHSDVEDYIRNSWLVNLFYLHYPADDRMFQGAIELSTVVQQNSDLPVLVAGSEQRKKLMQELPLLGLSKDSILIQGERGVGKKLVARSIHGFSVAKRSKLEFIDAKDITGQWIRETKMRADALTRAAVNPIVHVIENIENLPYAQQSQLLLLKETNNSTGNRWRQERTLAPIITLSGCNLETRAQKGSFRQDLYHRLSVLKLTIPPLRGHLPDIRLLAEYFAAFYGVNTNGGICRLPDDVLDVFESYHWPGNVPELKRSIKHLIQHDRANWMKQLPFDKRANDQDRTPHADAFSIDANDIHDYLEANKEFSLKKVRARYAKQVEKRLMKEALAQTKGNCKKAAILLNISYKSMLNKAKEYRLV